MSENVKKDAATANAAAPAATPETRIVGIKYVDFTPQGENPIKGFNVYITETAPANTALYGVITAKFWAKPEMMADAMQRAGLADYRQALGQSCTLVYNRYGKPDAFSIGE